MKIPVVTGNFGGLSTSERLNRKRLLMPASVSPEISIIRHRQDFFQNSLFRSCRQEFALQEFRSSGQRRRRVAYAPYGEGGQGEARDRRRIFFRGRVIWRFRRSHARAAPR